MTNMLFTLDTFHDGILLSNDDTISNISTMLQTRYTSWDDISLLNSDTAKKHTHHTCHTEFVLRWYIIIKFWYVTKHSLHACHNEYIPRRYVNIKCWRRLENIANTRSTKFIWKVVTEFLNKIVADEFDLSNYTNIYITAKKLCHNSLQLVNTAALSVVIIASYSSI